MIAKSLQFFALFAALSTAIFAQTKPNFTGDWKMDTLRSRLDEKSTTKAATMKIDHAEPALKIALITETDKGSLKHDYALKTDGSETRHTLDEQSCVSVAKWDEPTPDRIIIRTNCTNADGAHTEIVRELKLGGEGKMLTTTVAVKRANDSTKSYEFFTREEAEHP